MSTLTPIQRSAAPIAAAPAINLPFGTIYAFSVFLKPMETMLGISRADMTLIFGLAACSLTAGMNLAPFLFRRLSPFTLIAMAGAFSAVGLALTARASGLFELMVGYGLLFGLGGGVAFIVVQQGVNQTVQTKTGLVNGLPHWADYLGTRRWPDARTLGLAVLLMLVSMPLVLFLYNVNKALPLPDLLRNLESDTNEALKGLLNMQGIGELLANLLIIALIPAIGEELLFRGVLQQQLMRRIANPLIAILAAALIFSFIHFQFEGFLSRALLGVLLGWMYWKTGNFWIPVTAHFFNNGLQVVGQYLYGQEISTIDLEQDIDIPWAAALLSAVLVWGIVRSLSKLYP